MLLRYLLGRESVPRCAQARIDGALNARHEALPVAAHGTPTSAEASHIQQRTQMRSLPQGRHEPYASAHAGASACPAASLGRSRPPLVLSAELLAARPLLRASVVLDLSLDGEFMLAYAIVDNAESARSPRQTGGGSSGDESVYVFRAFSLPPACELRAEFPLFESFDGSSGNDGDDGRGVFRASVGVPHLAIDMVQTDAGLIVFHAYDSEPANGIGTASAANRNEAQVHHITIVPNSSVLAATPNKAQSLFVSARASSVHSATLSSSSTSSASTFAMPPAKCDACSLCALCRGSRAGIAWHASFRSYAPHFRLTASSLLGSNPKSATPASAASASACANQWDASAAASASLAESAAASILPLHSSLVGTGSTNRGIRLMFNAGDAVHSAIVRLDCSQHDLALTAACPSAERCITSTTEADVQSSSLSAGVVPRGLLAGAFQRSEWLQVSPPRRQRCTAHSGSHCTHRHSPPSDSDSRVFRVEVTEQFTCDIERLLQTVLSAPCSMATLESSAPALPSASNFAYESPVSGLSVDCRRDRSELAIIDASDALCRLLTSLDLRVDDFELISIKTLAADAAQYALNIIATPGGSSADLVGSLNRTFAESPSSPRSTSSDSIFEQCRRNERRSARALKAAALRACVHMGNPSLIVLAPQSQGDQACADDDTLTRNAEMASAFSAASARTETSADALVDFGEDCSPLVLVPLLVELNAITGHASVRVSVTAADYVGATIASYLARTHSASLEFGADARKLTSFAVQSSRAFALVQRRWIASRFFPASSQNFSLRVSNNLNLFLGVSLTRLAHPRLPLRIFLGDD